MATIGSQFDVKIPAVGDLSAERVREALSSAIAAPSLHNSQPWRFRLSPDTIELYADDSRALPAADPDHREMWLACGAALLNLRVAIRAAGVRPAVRLLPDPVKPRLLAQIKPQGAVTATLDDLELRRAIERRRTNRRPFSDQPVPVRLIADMRQAARLERSWMATLTPVQQTRMRVLLTSAHRVQQSDPAYLGEWAAWAGREPGPADGVPLRSSGPLPESYDQWVLRDFSVGTGSVRVPGKDFESDPLIAVVGSFHDLPLSFLQAGQAMQRVLLVATRGGLASSFLSQVVEVAPIRGELRGLLGGALWPQAVLRLGYGTTVPPTPRRDLAEVIEVAG